jgi:hypothetical protein
MKIDVKGIKGLIIKWALPYIIKYLRELILKMSGSARKKLIIAVRNFEDDCKRTDNRYDDIMADLLKGLLGVN